jgi:hypothetical protein
VHGFGDIEKNFAQFYIFFLGVRSEFWAQKTGDSVLNINFVSKIAYDIGQFISSECINFSRAQKFDPHSLVGIIFSPIIILIL